MTFEEIERIKLLGRKLEGYAEATNVIFNNNYLNCDKDTIFRKVIF